MLENQTLEFEDIRIDVPWGHIAGRWYGNRKVRPILALHGWQDNLGTWDRLLPLLPRHIGILCIDFPGHGHSSKYPKGVTYHVIDYVALIIRVMKEYNWKKISLMGHSQGGYVCFIYAALYPNTIDMLIQIDIIKPPRYPSELILYKMEQRAVKLIVENERLYQNDRKEPPSYTYDELEQLLYEGSQHWIEKEYCKHILNRSIAQSRLNPDKYYFSRDGRVKYDVEFDGNLGLSVEMAKRIRNLNYLVVEATRTEGIITNEMKGLIEMLRENNNFHMHTIEGTHHIHLNNPKEVAELVAPFIMKHRPVQMDTWSVDDDKVDVVYKKSKRRSKM